MNKKQFVEGKEDSKGKISDYTYISTALYEEKKSKFYSYIFNISSSKEANEILSELRKEYKDARHIVYAYVLENESYCSDDGEPSGTGGKAIFTLLEKQKITNTLVVVIRYFGGILLGAGPLLRAYLKSVKLAEEKIQIVDFTKKNKIDLISDYNEETIVRNIIEKTNSSIENVEYKDKVKFTILVDENKEKLFDKYKI